jgi:hypothetical protein
MMSHQSNYEPKLIDRDAETNLKTYRHPHCPGWRIILSSSGIPLATSDIGIKGYFIGQVAYDYITDALNVRQKKGPTQPSEYFNIVTTVWRTYTGGNEECSVWLEGLMSSELDNYVMLETGLIRELEKSTREWTTLYLCQTQLHYPSPDDRALALNTLFQQRGVKTGRTFRTQNLQEVTDSLNALCTSIPVPTRTTPSSSQARPPGGPAHSTSQSEANLPTRGSNVPAGSQRSNGERINALRQQLDVAMVALRTAQAHIPTVLTAYNQALAAAADANVDNATTKITS